MRKIDYAALAAIIRDTRETANANREAWVPGHPSAEYWRGAESKARDIAHRFADTASVNRAEFLKACGIDP
jgi:ABC-type microcin C transport system permease subunit YejE